MAVAAAAALRTAHEASHLQPFSQHTVQYLLSFQALVPLYAAALVDADRCSPAFGSFPSTRIPYTVMAPKAKKQRLEVEDIVEEDGSPAGSDSDSDDAPEEFGLNSAREQALAQRNHEKESAKQHREQLRNRNRKGRQQAAAGAEAPDDAPDQKKSANADGGNSGGDEGEEEGADGGPESEPAEDLLPDDVLQAVAAQQQEADELAAAQQAVQAASKRALRRAAKRQQLQAAKQSVVQVRVLQQLKPKPATSNFLKESLYGGRLKRSVDMLSSAKHRPSAKFV